MEDDNLYLSLRKMSHTMYLPRIILRPLSALFGLQVMLPMEKSVTFTCTCTNTEWITRSFVSKAKEGDHVKIGIIVMGAVIIDAYIYLTKKSNSEIYKDNICAHSIRKHTNCRIRNNICNFRRI